MTSTPEIVEPPLWRLSRAEQHALCIAFVGGAASVVVGAAVIGGSIALARGLKAVQLPVPGLINLTLLYLVHRLARLELARMRHRY